MTTTEHDRTADRLTLFFALILGVVAALYRLAPYTILADNAAFVWNLMPVGALCLFVGSRLRSHWAYLFPVAVMVVSDLLLVIPLSKMGYSAFGWGRLLIYASFTVYVLIGRMIQMGELHPAVIGGAALLAGLQFFLITNLGVWLAGGGKMYAMTWQGLMTCYIAALPFYKNTFLGDLYFSGLIFGLHAALLFVLARRKARQPV